MNNSIKSGIYSSVLYIIIAPAVHFLVKPLDFTSLIIGISVGGCNFYVILWAWSRIILKKRIALALGVIVIKYAIILSVLYYLVNVLNNYLVSFLIGIFSMVILTICYTALKRSETHQ